jgi:hypothetical protein
MTSNTSAALSTDLEQFRLDLYELLPYRRDTLLDLLDALSSNTTARSVVELSLSPFFRRSYSSITDGIDNFFQASAPGETGVERGEWEQKLVRLVAPYLPPPQVRKFWLFGIDVTPQPRPFAETLAERTYVYQPNTLAGNKPVNIGHQSSLLALLPEKGETSPPWVVPLSVRRVSSDETKNEAGAAQVKAVLSAEKLPFSGQLKVLVGDSDYSARSFLGEIYGDEADQAGKKKSDEQVAIVRSAGNRTFYHPPPKIADKNPVGHPTWYGEPFRLSDEETWGAPDEEEWTTWTTHRGKTYDVRLRGWHNIRMTGTKEYPMHKYPFTLVRADVLDEAGRSVFKRPMWLIVMGQRRAEVSLVETWEAYGQRVDLEHYFRFGKQKLLLGAYHTPDVEHADNWGQLVPLAYIFLWLAAGLVEDMPRPWERPTPKSQEMVSPARAQRGFGAIISQIGTPAQAPKPRGYSPGRATGQKQAPRKRHPVIKKDAKGQRSSAAA